MRPASKLKAAHANYGNPTVGLVGLNFPLQEYLHDHLASERITSIPKSKSISTANTKHYEYVEKLPGYGYRVIPLSFIIDLLHLKKNQKLSQTMFSYRCPSLRPQALQDRPLSSTVPTANCLHAQNNIPTLLYSPWEKY